MSPQREFFITRRFWTMTAVTYEGYNNYIHSRTYIGFTVFKTKEILTKNVF